MPLTKRIVLVAVMTVLLVYAAIGLSVYSVQASEPLLVHDPSVGTTTLNTIPVYRFWSEEYKSHFFTMSEFEKNHVIAFYDDDTWIYEGIAFFAFTEDAENRSPVNRYWSSTLDAHFYSSSTSELVALSLDESWNFESIEWYLYDEPQLYSVPLHRFYSKVFERHFYTLAEKEKDFIIANDSNWEYEGVTAYVPI